MQPTKFTTTYSFWGMFQLCQRKAFNRYVRGIVKQRHYPPTLSFGTVIHEALALWHSTRDMDAVEDIICAQYTQMAPEAYRPEDVAIAKAMMLAYIRNYEEEEFKVVVLEKQFRQPIVNPDTGYESRSCEIAGKVDGVVQNERRFSLLEHKTTTQIGGAYLERLPTDLQIQIYSHFISLELDIHIQGVIYNVLQKPLIRLRKNEDMDGYRERLTTLYENPEMFHREALYFSHDDIMAMQRRLWGLTKQLLECRRHNRWLQNTNACFHWLRACQYFNLCKSHDSPIVLDNEYESRPPHEELEL